MSASRGSLTVTRLFVKGELPRDLRQRFLSAVRLRAFEPLKPEDEATEAIGWCVMERPLDLDFHLDKIFDDRFLLLGLRIDRFRVPAAMVRAQLIEEEQKLLTRTGKNRVSRNERLELKEKIVLRLRRKIAPATRSIDMVWDLDAGLVLLFTHSRRVIADFCALFEKTFRLELSEDSPYAAARRQSLSDRLLRALDRLEPISLSAALPEPKRQRGIEAVAHSPRPATESAAPPETEEGSDDQLERIETTRFLGSEFLLWIWLRGEFSTEAIQLPGPRELQVWLDQSLTLESAIDRNERVTIRGVAPADGFEAREAVRARKFPVRARVVVHSAERELAFALIAPRFAVAAGRLPAVLKSESSEAFSERMTLADELFATLDQLYSTFLLDRLGENWKRAWEPAVSAWVQGEPVSASLLAQLDLGPRKRVRKARAAVD